MPRNKHSSCGLLSLTKLARVNTPLRQQMSAMPAFSPGFFGPVEHERRSGRAKTARVDHGPPVPVHAVFQLAPGGVSFVAETDDSVFLSGRPILQPGSQLTQMTINGYHKSDTEVRRTGLELLNISRLDYVDYVV